MSQEASSREGTARLPAVVAERSELSGSGGKGLQLQSGTYEARIGSFFRSTSEMAILQQLWRPASEFRLRSPGAKVSNEGLLV